MPQSEIIEAYDGTEVGFEDVKPLSGGGARVDLDAENGPKLRLDVTKSGKYEVVTSWNADGELADVDEPDWVEDIVAQLQRA
ncbi:hypothetical protein [Halorussus halobius]|uniref:hypothetical protein n=1 Tax=Halorussus halobius TaxID=1710537 RepID=UPI0010930E90|nr:hypothetical protein [Halorussus halobius]